ncbi:hypothetical protein ACHAWO_005271 [Cyclotella atomus]|uniref:CRAL-TRIO domain-containing protein n=1 Tax=Cyclotella atomus TaxID=382360 RepID=A0ABD3NDF8_9STRA
MKILQLKPMTYTAALASLCFIYCNLISVEGWRQPFILLPSIKSPSEHFQIFNVRGGDDTPSADIAPETSADDSAETAKADTATNDETLEPRNLTFPATNPYDGHDQDPDGIPTRFLQMKNGNRDDAKESWEAHLAWRKEFEVDTLLSRPHKLFDVCKAQVPHYFSGRDPHGNVIFVQRPAMLDFELMRRNNATMEDLLLHYVYVIEYCWSILDPSPPEKVMTNVLDMKGLSFRSMRNQEYIGFGKRFVQMMSANYPGRSYKTLIINAPSWFHALYKIFKPLLRESTRQKIVILKAGEKQDTALKFYLGDAVPKDLLSEEDEKETNGGRYFIPVDDASQCEPGPNSAIEFEMRQFCIEQLKLHNETLQEVL